MPAYFVFKQEDLKKNVLEFVFSVSDSNKANEARQIIADPSSTNRHVSGTIVPTRIWYNTEWSYHFDPSTIGFFELSMEVCDANIQWVEENLVDIGGSALPGMFWCPWSSRLDREVFPIEPDGSK